MADEFVRIKIEADTSDLDKKTGKSRERLEELNKQKMSDLEKQFEKLGLGLDKFTKEQVRQIKITKDQSKQLNNEKDSYFKLNAEMNLNKKILKSLTTEQVANEKIGGKLKRTINEQSEALKKFDKNIGDSQRSVGGYKEAINKSFLAIGGAIAAGLAVFNKIKNATIEWVNLSNIQETAVRRLNFQLGENAQKYIDLAAELQKVTKYGDEGTIQLISLASAMGASEKNLEKITTGAMGLSTALGIDLSTAARMATSAIESQDYTLLNRYLPSLKSATNEAEKAKIVQEAMAKGFELAKEEAVSGAGALQSYDNTVGDFKEVLGSLVKQVIVPMLPILTTMINGFSNFFSLFKSTDTVISKSIEARVEFDKLSDTFIALSKKTELTKDEQEQLKTTIEDLQRLSPNTLKNLGDENTLLKDKVKLLNDTKEALLQNAIVEMKKNELAEIYNDMAAIQREQAERDIEYQKKRSADKLKIAQLEVDKEMETTAARKGLFDTRIQQIKDGWTYEDNAYNNSSLNRAKDLADLQQIADEKTAIYKSLGAEFEELNKSSDSSGSIEKLKVDLNAKLAAEKEYLESKKALNLQFLEDEQEPEDLGKIETLETGEGSEEVEQIANQQKIHELFAQMNYDAREQELAAVDEYYAALMEKAEGNAAAQLEVEMMHNAAITKIDEKYQKQKTKIYKDISVAIGNTMTDAFNAMLTGEKKAGEAIGNGLISTLQAVIDAYVAAEVGKALIAAPMSFGATLAAIAPIIAAGGVANAALEAIKFADGGVLQGPSHANGGIAMGGNQEAEGGEIILTKAVSASPAGLNEAAALNVKYGGRDFGTGSPAPSPSRMANGGVVTNTTNNIDIDKLASQQELTNNLLNIIASKEQAVPVIEMDGMEVSRAITSNQKDLIEQGEA